MSSASLRHGDFSHLVFKRNHKASAIFSVLVSTLNILSPSIPTRFSNTEDGICPRDGSGILASLNIRPA